MNQKRGVLLLIVVIDTNNNINIIVSFIIERTQQPHKQICFCVCVIILMMISKS